MPGRQVNEVIAASARIPAQRLMMTDLLGLAGGPGTQGTPMAGLSAASQGLAMAGVPAVSVRVPDMSLLPGMPVWDLVGGLLPFLGGSR